MIRAVVDVNIFVSGHLKRSGPPFEVLTAIKQGEVRVIASPEFFDELDDTLHRRRFAKVIPANVADRAVLEIRRTAEMHYTEEDPTPITRDSDDDYLIRLARVASVDYLISGDRDLLDDEFDGVVVVSPADFVNNVLKK